MTQQLKNKANAVARRPLAAMLCAGALSIALAGPVLAANPCSPCAAKCAPAAMNPCAANPCAASPCAAKNPCAAKSPCAANPCAAKSPCAAKNPCAAKSQ